MANAANAKNTLNEYNKTKWELALSTAQLAQEKKEVFGLSKDQKQVFVDMLKWWVEKDQINEIYKKTYWVKLQNRKALTQEYKEKNKDLIKRYQVLYTQKKLNEENLKELIKKAKELGFDNEEELRAMIMWTSEQKEAKESPRKALEQERKTAAIVELDRLGMKTDKRVEAINAIQFLDDKILIDKTPWAYENMKWGEWVFKEKTNKRYYDFKERKAEAKKQWIVLPKKEDFENTFKALDLEKDNTWKHILAIILWESRDGYCDSGGFLDYNGTYGCLGSVSEYFKGYARSFRFDKDKGGLLWHNKFYRFVCRPLVKNS
jgi:hypothetical protein